MTDVRFDWERQARTGVPEVVLAEGKTVGQIASILTAAADRQCKLLLTRLPAEQYRDLESSHAFNLDYDPLSRTAILGNLDVLADAASPAVGVVCAGTSDLPVALEAQRSLAFFGLTSNLYADVGVAGLWRVTQIQEQLKQHSVLIAVAGMEGALFSVLAGLVPALLIAVPSSVGYGVASGGKAALSSALASCAPGVVTVNIDNGFGAAAAARKIIRIGRSDAVDPNRPGAELAGS